MKRQRLSAWGRVLNGSNGVTGFHHPSVRWFSARSGKGPSPSVQESRSPPSTPQQQQHSATKSVNYPPAELELDLSLLPPPPSPAGVLQHDLVFPNLGVEEILRRKKVRRPMAAVQEEDTVATALSKLVEANVGAVMVKDHEGKLSGMFSERDVIRELARYGAGIVDLPVSQVMSKQVVCISPYSTALECMRTMSDRRVRHLPICASNRGDVLGIVSIGDLVVTVVSEYHQAIEYYREYIEGKYSGPIAKEDKSEHPAINATTTKGTT